VFRSGFPPDVSIDPNGNRASLVYPNGVETSYLYDDLNRLTNLTTTGPGGTHIQSYDFTLGPAGNRTQIIEHLGVPLLERTLDYTYDDLCRLKVETVTETAGEVYSKTFNYDAVGNRQEQVTTGQGAGTIAYLYDERDRLTDEGGQAYGWDENGNLISKDAEATHEWDYENRLSKVTLLDGTLVEHVYDADGNRVQTTTTPLGGSAETVNYLIDTCCSLSHVVAETNGTGSLLATYVRGDDLLAVIRPTETRYFHADGIGSIRRLTNEDGIITDGYTYTAFGELIAHTGSDPQPYAFTGEPLDPNVGWQYHSAARPQPSQRKRKTKPQRHGDTENGTDGWVARLGRLGT
jgi:uncharacterized protein RhaS with RHS repeats